MPFLNLHMSPERMLRGDSSRQNHALHRNINDRRIGRDGKHCAAGDDRGFMLFEVRHVPYKLRFALKQSTNP